MSKLKIKTSSVSAWRSLCWWPDLSDCLVTSSISQGRPQKKPADYNCWDDGEARREELGWQSEDVWRRHCRQRPWRPEKELDWHHKTRFKGNWHILGGRQHCVDREDWRQCMVQCVFDTEWTKECGEAWRRKIEVHNKLAQLHLQSGRKNVCMCIITLN